MQFLEKIKKDNDFLRKLVSLEYASPWRTAMENVDTLVESVETLDEALTITIQERDDAYDEIDRLKSK